MAERSLSQRFLVLGAVFAGLAVAAGAFGAHALKKILDEHGLQVFDTATRYQMYHAFGLCIVAWAIDRYPRQRLEQTGWLFTLGILLFSGSLYVVSLATHDPFRPDVLRLGAALAKVPVSTEVRVLPGRHDKRFAKGPAMIDLLLFHDGVLRGRCRGAAAQRSPP